MNDELERDFQRGIFRSPKNLGIAAPNISNCFRRFEPFLTRVKYDIRYHTYYNDDILYHRLVAWPYANNVVFVCYMRYFWQSDVLHFHISSSNGVKNNDFSSLTNTPKDFSNYTWRVDEITGPEIVAEDYIYYTLGIAYWYYFERMFIPSSKFMRGV